jgi:hypothetical protein
MGQNKIVAVPRSESRQDRRHKKNYCSTRTKSPYCKIRCSCWLPFPIFALCSYRLTIHNSVPSVSHTKVAISTMMLNKSTALAFLAISSFASANDRNLRAVSRVWRAFLLPSYFNMSHQNYPLPSSPGPRLDCVSHFWSCN